MAAEVCVVASGLSVRTVRPVLGLRDLAVKSEIVSGCSECEEGSVPKSECLVLCVSIGDSSFHSAEAAVVDWLGVSYYSVEPPVLCGTMTE